MRDGWVNSRDLLKRATQKSIGVPDPNKNSTQATIKVISLEDLEKAMEQSMSESN